MTRVRVNNFLSSLLLSVIVWWTFDSFFLFLSTWSFILGYSLSWWKHTPELQKPSTCWMTCVWHCFLDSRVYIFGHVRKQCTTRKRGKQLISVYFFFVGPCILLSLESCAVRKTKPTPYTWLGYLKKLRRRCRDRTRVTRVTGGNTYQYTTTTWICKVKP